MKGYELFAALGPMPGEFEVLISNDVTGLYEEISVSVDWDHDKILIHAVGEGRIDP